MNSSKTQTIAKIHLQKSCLILLFSLGEYTDASLIRFVDPGLVDTGADVTVIRDLEWPDHCGFRPGVCDRH
ncbi:unnamed protein product [Caretta caretta]